MAFICDVDKNDSKVCNPCIISEEQQLYHNMIQDKYLYGNDVVKCSDGELVSMTTDKVYMKQVTSYLGQTAPTPLPCSEVICAGGANHCPNTVSGQCHMCCNRSCWDPAVSICET